MVAGGEGELFHAAAQEIGVQGPIFLGLKRLDLPLPVVHHAGGNRLDPAGGEPAADLLPQQGAELVAHQAVQDAAGLLGVHQVLVDVPGLPDALLHHLFRDLVEGDPAGLAVRQVQQMLQVPGDGLALTVRVGGEIDHVRRLGGLFQVADDVLFPLDGLVDRLEIPLHIHAQGAFGQVPQVAHAGLDLKVLAQVFADGFGLRGRLHDDQAVFCHSYLQAPVSGREFIPSRSQRGYSVFRCAAGPDFQSQGPSAPTAPAWWGCQSARSSRPPAPAPRR